MASVLTLDGRRSPRRGRKQLRGVTTRKYSSCGNLKWHSGSSGKAAYASVGKGDPAWRPMIRIECYNNGTCKAEVFVGRSLISRNRRLPTMEAAKEWACQKAMR